MITEKEIHSLFPNCKKASEFSDSLNRVFAYRDINTKLRVCMFLCQVGHESQGLTRLVENLNYSAGALTRTWPNRFPSIDIAKLYERKPEEIANKVYSNRMGNGPPESGDGFRYRGRGLIQLTGKSNYQACATALGVDLGTMPAFLESVDGACRSAGWFWTTVSGNFYSDSGDIINLTRKINGGLNGLADRQSLYKKAFEIIGG
jgi:putative chitinase